MRGRGTPGQRMTSLTAAMAARQRSDRPVADWTLAQLDEGGGWEHDFLKVEQIMTTDFQTVHEDDPASLVANIMDWNRVRQVLVEETGFEFDILMQVYDGKTGELLYSDNFKDFKTLEGAGADPIEGMFQNLFALEDRIVGIFAKKDVESTRVLYTP